MDLINEKLAVFMAVFVAVFLTVFIVGAASSGVLKMPIGLMSNLLMEQEYQSYLRCSAMQKCQLSSIELARLLEIQEEIRD